MYWMNQIWALPSGSAEREGRGQQCEECDNRGTLSPKLERGVEGDGRRAELIKEWGERAMSKSHACESTGKNVFRFSMEKTNRHSGRIYFALNRELESQVKETTKLW